MHRTSIALFHQLPSVIVKRFHAQFRVCLMMALALYPFHFAFAQNTILTPDAAVPDNSSDNLKDYVPCLMDRSSLYAMRGRRAPNRPVDPKTLLTYSAAVDIINKLSVRYSNDDANTFKMAAINYLDALKTGVTYGDVTDAIKEGTDAIVNPIKEKSEKAKQNNKGASEQVQAQDAATEDAAVKAANKVAGDTKSAGQAALVAAATTYARPKDIGCSMVVYPWNVAHMVFGRTVANHFLAVQVTVRNLDPDHEFLIHDAELAVDATSGQLERFQEGVEKQAVRGVTIYGQNYDRRAVLAHSVEGIGIILGSIVGLPQPAVDNLTAASGSYAAGFVPTFGKLFPDLSTSNLNNLNDLGFSAAAASRIVVPKGGSVPFVIFIPLKPLEQACWLQDGYVPALDFYPNTACEAIFNNKTNPPTQLIAKADGSATENWNRKKWPLKNRDVRYSSWTADQVTALEKHAFAVVAGTHIQAVTASAAAARSILCKGTTNTNGVLLLASITGSLTCTLTGASLDTLTKLRLKSQVAGSAFQPLDVPLVQSGDSTTANITLTSANIALLTEASYSVFGLDATSTESDLHFTWTVIPSPVVSATPVASPSTAAAITGTPFSLTITGSNLSQVTQVILQVPAVSGASATTFATVPVSNVKDVLIIANFPKQPTAVAGAYEVLLVVGTSTPPLIVDSTKSIQF